MKIIAIMPVKNEAWILPYALKCLEQFCDHIIVADQNSTDGTSGICKKFTRVILIKNLEKFHSNTVRWNLLESARNFDGNNLILAIDADEFMSPHFVRQYLPMYLQNLKPGMGLNFRWIQLWKSLERFNVSLPWAPSWKTVGWCDNRKIFYDEKFIINDHTSRIPTNGLKGLKNINEIPFLHLQWVAWERTQYKQAWYRCAELIKYPGRALEINRKYAITLDNPYYEFKDTPSEWFTGIDFPPDIGIQYSGWHKNEIFAWFNEKGLEFFEPLQIWHIPQLRNEFINKIGREPQPVIKCSIFRKAKRKIRAAKNILKEGFLTYKI